MRIAEIGEFGLITKIAALIDEISDGQSPARRDLLLGIGDDAAAWKSPGGIELITTDILVEEVHFDFAYTDWKNLGWKSMAINISDINSMGGRPRYALVSLALPGRGEAGDVLDLYRGILEISNTFGIAVAGGNISASDKVVINITLTGLAEGNIMTRSSAQPGDLVAVFGFPGLSSAGRKALSQFIDLDADALRIFKNAHIRPSPDFNNGPLLASLGVKTAIDISDGLAADLTHICMASGVAATLHLNNLPVHPLLTRYFGRDSLKMCLAGGEDYQLLLTAAPDVLKRVNSALDQAPVVIGEITEGQPYAVSLLDEAGNPVHIDFSGWDHYKHPN
ncbi:MAG: thiamine-phosphate kinase [Dehalococcoidia bacterium]|nr:thiamine-phosphate kinase [Dehalococcoidia bacterium]MDD5647895.1 thiamine-phosphate kinase [Dehalococcoidia bacterium]